MPPPNLAPARVINALFSGHELNLRASDVERLCEAVRGSTDRRMLWFALKNGFKRYRQDEPAYEQSFIAGAQLRPVLALMAERIGSDAEKHDNPHVVAFHAGLAGRPMKAALDEIAAYNSSSAARGSRPSLGDKPSPAI
jgi:hypothetical protein